MCDHKRLDRSRNVVIRDTLTVNKIKNARLRWFDHINNMDAPGGDVKGLFCWSVEDVKIDLERIGTR